jgi:hypothetical protein
MLIGILIIILTSFTSDPNTKANRAPGQTELDTLRVLMKQNENTMEYFDHRLGEGEKLLSSIRERYDEQRTTLECTLSELHATSHFVETLKNQKTAVQTQWNRLSGLVHPVRRCNEDVLQYIFKWAVELDDSRFKCATRISSVCKRWRNLAVKTPILWTRIDIRTDRNPSTIRSFWERTVSRLGQKTPPTVRLTLVGSKSEQKALKSFAFRGLYHIQHLHIDCRSRASATRLFELSFGPLNVDNLSLFIDTPDEDDDDDDEFEFTIDIACLSADLKTWFPWTSSAALFSHRLQTPTIPLFLIS